TPTSIGKYRSHANTRDHSTPYSPPAVRDEQVKTCQAARPDRGRLQQLSQAPTPGRQDPVQHDFRRKKHRLHQRLSPSLCVSHSVISQLKT
ncbi:hypothetical protein LSAT2_029295, partial [Lamellibrachia satsuma]